MLSYDPVTSILISVSLMGSAREAWALLDNLTEVDLATWRTLVESVNADPLRPR